MRSNQAHRKQARRQSALARFKIDPAKANDAAYVARVTEARDNLKAKL